MQETTKNEGLAIMRIYGKKSKEKREMERWRGINGRLRQKKED